jgi:pimeloyl-ACP methyl ester carboxylesterase
MARFVLVHGAFAGGWCWKPVTGPLRAMGHTVETLDLPGSGDDQTPVGEVTLARYAERVCEVLARRPERAVLVGHSMGGVVVTQAAANCPDRIASLIFVCAFMPADGESLIDLTRLPEGAADQIQANLVVEGDPPVAVLSEEATVMAVYNCCPPAEAVAAAARRGAQPVAPIEQPVRIDETVLASIPRSYVLTTKDNAIPPDLQRRMIREHPCRRVIELETDHSPFQSATAELVNALVELADEMAQPASDGALTPA